MNSWNTGFDEMLQPFWNSSTCLQFNYAVVTSTEVAYLSYIYSIIPVENYQRATGYLRGAMLFGYTFGASLGQVLVSVAGTVGLHYLVIDNESL